MTTTTASHPERRGPLGRGNTASVFTLIRTDNTLKDETPATLRTDTALDYFYSGLVTNNTTVGTNSLFDVETENIFVPNFYDRTLSNRTSKRIKSCRIHKRLSRSRHFYSQNILAPRARALEGTPAASLHIFLAKSAFSCKIRLPLQSSSIFSARPRHARPRPPTTNLGPRRTPDSPPIITFSPLRPPSSLRRRLAPHHRPPPPPTACRTGRAIPPELPPAPPAAAVPDTSPPSSVHPSVFDR